MGKCSLLVFCLVRVYPVISTPDTQPGQGSASPVPVHRPPAEEQQSAASLRSWAPLTEPNCPCTQINSPKCRKVRSVLHTGWAPPSTRPVVWGFLIDTHSVPPDIGGFEFMICLPTHYNWEHLNTVLQFPYLEKTMSLKAHPSYCCAFLWGKGRILNDSSTLHFFLSFFELISCARPRKQCE